MDCKKYKNTKLFIKYVMTPGPPLAAPSLPADGNGQRHLNCAFAGQNGKPLGEGPSSEGAFANLFMNGQEVFKFAVKAVPTVRGGGF